MKLLVLDSIEHNFLYKALARFIFSSAFISGSRRFIITSQAVLSKKRVFSSPFQLKRGVRQGDPLSPYVFLISIEIMAISIRTNIQIEGIKIGEKEITSLLYAYDMIATLANISSVEKVMQALNDFEK